MALWVGEWGSAVIGTLGLPRAILVGHSMGALAGCR